MKELLKKKIQNIILEMSSDMDEMADWRDMYGLPKKTGRDIVTKSAEEKGYRAGHEKNPVGKVGRSVYDSDTNSEIPVVFVCDKDITDFMNEHPEIIAELKEKYGDDLRWTPGNFPYCQVRRKKGELYPLPGTDKDVKITDTSVKYETEHDEKNRILRIFNPLIKEYLENDEVTNHLELASIPTIRGKKDPNDPDAFDARTYRNNFGEFNNNKIEFVIHNFNSYNAAPDFLNAVVQRVRGNKNVKGFMEYPLARQFKNIYRTWNKDRKNQKEYRGLTDIYQLKKYGLEENNLDVLVAMFLKIDGRLMGDTYEWVINFTTEHGKKLKEDFSLKGGLLKDLDIRIIKTAEIEPGKTFDNKNTVMDDIDIKSALIEGLTELKEKLLSINPKDALKKANVSQLDVSRTTNEEKISNFIKNVIKESKSGYEIYHKSYTSAVNTALEYAEKRGYTYDHEETADKIGMGPKKPSEGKTNRITIQLMKDGKKQKKSLHIQVYGMRDKYELNTYIN
jgi:hypothetical protein